MAQWGLDAVELSLAEVFMRLVSSMPSDTEQSPKQTRRYILWVRVFVIENNGGHASPK